MVSLKSNQLILQGLELRFQGRSNQSQVIQKISQAIDVSLHGLTDDQLILIPAQKKKGALHIHFITVCRLDHTTWDRVS